MKILSYAWYIYDSRLEQYQKNCTGGGLVVRDLCEYLGKHAESYLFIGQYTFPELELGKINIVQTNYNPTIKKKIGIDEEYLEYMTNCFEKAVDKIEPDIIHFHDPGDLARKIIIEVCAKRNIKYSMTCHLFIGKNPPFKGYDKNVTIEAKMMELADLNLVTVSTGMKDKIMKYYPTFPAERITPLLNGTSFDIESSACKKKEHINSNRKILLCSGTICYRKNQLQLLNILKKNNKLREECEIWFCGNIIKELKDLFELEVKELSDCVEYKGALSTEEMKEIYMQIDGLIMPSLAEGLSIAMLESIAYGKSVIMFKDSECAKDLKDERVVQFIDNHSDESIVEAIEKWRTTIWNEEYIINYSKKFTMEKMSESYMNYFINLHGVDRT